MKDGLSSQIRLEFDGANHLISRGNAREDIFDEDGTANPCMSRPEDRIIYLTSTRIIRTRESFRVRLSVKATKSERLGNALIEYADVKSNPPLERISEHRSAATR